MSGILRILFESLLQGEREKEMAFKKMLSNAGQATI